MAAPAAEESKDESKKASAPVWKDASFMNDIRKFADGRVSKDVFESVTPFFGDYFACIVSVAKAHAADRDVGRVTLKDYKFAITAKLPHALAPIVLDAGNTALEKFVLNTPSRKRKRSAHDGDGDEEEDGASAVPPVDTGRKRGTRAKVPTAPQARKRVARGGGEEKKKDEDAAASTDESKHTTIEDRAGLTVKVSRVKNFLFDRTKTKVGPTIAIFITGGVEVLLKMILNNARTVASTARPPRKTISQADIETAFSGNETLTSVRACIV